MRVGLVGSSLPPFSPPSRLPFSSPWALRFQVSDSSCLVAPSSPCLRFPVSAPPHLCPLAPQLKRLPAACCHLPAVLRVSPSPGLSVSVPPANCPLPAGLCALRFALSPLRSVSPRLLVPLSPCLLPAAPCQPPAACCLLFPVSPPPLIDPATFGPVCRPPFSSVESLEFLSLRNHTFAIQLCQVS
jgi:hypothetical protein